MAASKEELLYEEKIRSSQFLSRSSFAIPSNPYVSQKEDEDEASIGSDETETLLPVFGENGELLGLRRGEEPQDKWDISPHDLDVPDKKGTETKDEAMADSIPNSYEWSRMCFNSHGNKF